MRTSLSPDRQVSDPSGTPKFRLLKVKGLFAMFRDGISMQEAAQQPDFCLTVDSSGALKLKHNHAYYRYMQVQEQMAITGAKWCEFYIWSGRLIPAIQHFRNGSL